MLVQYYSVLQNTTLHYKVLPSTTKYYPVLQSISPYYTELLQYYSVLQSTTPAQICTIQSTTPVLLRTAKYYSSTNLYYKVLLQYYSVLQSTTLYYKVLPSTTLYYRVLLQYYTELLQYYCTTEYYSSTTLYYKVLLQYYSVLKSTTPVLLCTTKYYSVLQSTTPYWEVLHEMSFTMRGATIYNARSNRCHCPTSPNTAPATKNYSHDWCSSIWNVIYNARSNRCHCPTSPNTVPATQNDSHDWSLSHMKGHYRSFTMRGATGVIVQPRNVITMRDRSETVPSMIRPWSEHQWNRQSATRGATEVTFRALHEHVVWKNTTFRAPAIIPNFTEYCACHEKWQFNFTKCCACHEKWLSWSILFTHETLLFAMRGATAVIDQPHQILRLPRKVTLIIDPYTYETLFAMRGATAVIDQPHQMLRLPRKMTIQNLREIWWNQMKRHLECATDPRPMIRPWNRQSATCLATEVTFHAHQDHFVLKNI